MKKWQTFHFCRSGSESKWYIASSVCALTAQMMPQYRVKIL